MGSGLELEGKYAPVNPPVLIHTNTEMITQRIVFMKWTDYSVLELPLKYSQVEDQEIYMFDYCPKGQFYKILIKNPAYGGHQLS